MDNQLLERVYKSLVAGTEIEKLYHSDIHYIRAALREGGFELSLADTERLLYEEGLMPAKAYGIPRWFREKYEME